MCDFQECEVTLKELLDSREARVNHQKQLLNEHKERKAVLISVTLNIPGAVKDKPAYRKILRQGMEKLMDVIPSANVLHNEIRELTTGSEGYLVVCGFLPKQLKAMTVELEEKLPLGRLYDMDVLSADGGISRSDIGACKRKCFLCGDDAKVCARSQRHSIEELREKIDRMILEKIEK